MRTGRLLIVAVLAIALMIGFIVPAVYAERCGQRKGKGHHGDIGNMVCKKAMMMCKNKDELGLSDEQVERIKSLKIATKKNLIKTQAEIDIVKIDIRAEMWKDTVDAEAIKKLIDKEYELKKEKAKSSIDAYVNLKEILTEEQRKKLKTLFEDYHKKKMGKKGN